MLKKVDQLLLVGGTGRNVGKTTTVCSIITQNNKSGVCAIKITPHLHNMGSGVTLLTEANGYRIFEEGDRVSEKDTSRMLRAGATLVLLIQATDELFPEAFAAAMKIIGGDRPVICESPSLRHHTTPGMFILIKGNLNDISSRSDSSQLIGMADVVIESKDALNSKTPKAVWSESLKQWSLL